MAETTIGALAVRIGADASQLISELNKAEKALKAKELTFKNVSKAAAAYGAAIGAAGVAVFAFVKHVANGVDQLGKLSQKVGVSVESLSALKHAASIANVPLESLAQGLKILSRNMLEAQTGTGEALQAFKALGIGVADSSGNLKLTEEILLQLADKFEGMEDGAGKTALAMRIFGKSGADLIPLLNEGRAGIEAMKKEAERLGIVISKDAAEAAEKFNDNVTRLQAGIEGLTIKMAGPLIQAFGNATQAMLDAHKAGEGFFRMMSEGMLKLIMGSDKQALEREMAEAGEALLKAQDRLDRARRGDLPASPGKSVADDIRDAEKAVKSAEANIRRLRDIMKDPFASPDPDAAKGEKAGEKKKKKAPILSKESADEAARIARQIEEGEEEFRQTSTEAWEIYHKYLRGVFSDTTHELKINEEGIIEGVELRTRSVEERERQHYEERMKVLFEYIDAKAEAEEQAMRDEAAARDQHERDLDAMGYKHRQMNLAAAKTFFSHMASLMQTNSKKMFEIGKIGALAETAVNTATGAMAAYKAMAGIPYIGPALGAAAAAAVIAAGAAQMQNIRSQQFGGGTGAAGTFPASPTTGQPIGTPGGDVGPGVGNSGSRGPDTFINLPGTDLVSTESVRKLLERLNETMRDGGRIVVL